MPLNQEDNFDNYSDSNNENTESNSVFSLLANKKIVTIGSILVVVFILLILALIVGPIIRPDLFLSASNVSVKSNDDNISFKGSLSLNGELIDTFLSDGKTLTEKVNPRETKKIVLKTTGLSTGVKTASGVMVLSDGRRIQLTEDSVTITSDGTVTISINPEDDLGLTEEEIQELIDGTLNFDLILEIENIDGENTESLTIEIPVTLIFSEFFGLGCIEINRENVSETTHAGILVVDVKVKVTCETNDALYGVIKWKSERSGNVEFLFNNITDGSVLTTTPVPIKKSLPIGTYAGKIIFTPLKEFAGQRTGFDVIIGSGNSENKVVFDVALDNLEQCIRVTSPDSIIENENDYASINIDATKCASEKIDILLCDGDPTCSFAPEGGVTLSSNVFSLTGTQKTKNITIERGEIPGVYGVTVKARILGLEKTNIGEIEIFVKPTTELIVPDKFVVSLLGKSSKDSVRIKNTQLSERVKVDASVCALYKSSLGIKSDMSDAVMSSGASPISGLGFENSWWRKIVTEQEYYSGAGKYQLALAGSAGLIDNARITTQQISSQKNSLIKQAYLGGQDVGTGLNVMEKSASTSIDATKEMSDKLNNLAQYGQTDTAVQIATLITSTTAMITAFQLTTASLDETFTAGVEAGEMCSASAPGIASAVSSVSGAKAAQSSNYLIALQIVQITNNIYSLWQQVEALTKEKQELDVASTIENSETTISLIEKSKENVKKINDYLELALQSASVDSTISISSDYTDSKTYLELAKKEAEELKKNVDLMKQAHLDAVDGITTLQGDIPSDTEIYIQLGSLLVSAIDMIPAVQTSSEVITSELTTANASVTEALAFADAICIASKSPPWTADQTCCTAIPLIEKFQLSITNSQGLAGSQIAAATGVAANLAVVYNGMKTYETYNNDYTEELISATKELQKVTDAMYVLEEETNLSLSYYDPAIEAANYLSIESASTTDASTYTMNLTKSSEDFDKVTMTGLVATAIANGFINGAYEGGVYTTKDTRVLNIIPTASNAETKSSTKENKVSLAEGESASSVTLKEDCANRISLELIDYKTNLLTDAKDVLVSNGNVLSYWSFSDSKVNGFFESQEVGLVFVNSGLKKTSYGIVSLISINHTHDPLTTISGGDFGPFNITDSSTKEVTYKYHYKFNAAPRKTATTISSAVCENGLLLGNTGENALPKTILSWDWKAINDETIKGNYLDSTQLAILVSNKIKLFDEFMSRTSTSCPQNEAYNILEAIKPIDVTLSQPTCHLPLSTKSIEGKPAIYYFLNSTSEPPDGYDEFFEGSYASDRDQALNLIDFNVLLMRDGLGTNFQGDFVTDYTTQILKSNSGFTDSVDGMANYFRDNSRFYFSSEYQDMQKNESFILPDAGFYNIRILIEYDDPSNPLISIGGLKNAKIIVNPVLVTAINKDYSPFYYTPFDGSVGLNANNNRKYYGTAISEGSQFSVSKTDGSFLSTQQKDSLVKISQNTINNFSWLNSLPSNRGKLLDYVYSFGTSSTDTNSSLIFSPTIITPMLISVNGIAGQNPIVSYILTQNAKNLDPQRNNLLITSGLKGCYDFSGNDLSKTFNKTPDTLMGDYYGISFGNASTSGIVSVKSAIYLPVGQQYDLAFNPGGTIMTTNQLIPLEYSVKLEGIKGMPYNDLSNESYINGLASLFDAVKQESVCVSNLGDRETYYWPEDYLFEKENTNGQSLHDKEIELAVTCIKQ